MNFNFSHEILPSLLMPLQNLFPSFEPPFGFLGIAIPLLETLIGCGLLFRRSRNLAVCLILLMHSGVVSLLIAKDYNSIIWFWNFTLIFANIFAFWKNPISLKETVFFSRLVPIKVMVLASLLLPVLNFFGYWDSFLSGALYSGNVEIPAIRIDDGVFEELPPSAKSVVFNTKTTNEKMLPLFEWSIADTNAPVYLEERVFRQVLSEICELSTDKNKVELIIRKRPAIMDGTYEVRRISCTQISN